MKIAFVDNLTCTTNPKNVLIWTCLETENYSTQNSLLHKTGLKPIVFYGGLSKCTFKNNFRSPSVSFIALGHNSLICQPKYVYAMCSSNFAFEELVLRSLGASPLMKPFLTPGGWQDSKCVYWKVSVGLKGVIKNRVLFRIGRPCIHTYPRMLFQYLNSQP